MLPFPHFFPRRVFQGVGERAGNKKWKTGKRLSRNLGWGYCFVSGPRRLSEALGFGDFSPNPPHVPTSCSANGGGVNGGGRPRTSSGNLKTRRRCAQGSPGGGARGASLGAETRAQYLGRSGIGGSWWCWGRCSRSGESGRSGTELFPLFGSA